MKKRILSIVLSIVMLISLLPTTALAMESVSVYIDDVYMGDGNISTYYKNGDTGTLTGSENDYNAKLWKNGDVLTLTLNGLDLTSTSQYGIHANADLTIVLEGENTVKAADTVGKDSYGIFTLNALTFSGTGTLNVSGGKTDGYQTCAIYANGDLTMNGGTVIATGGATGDNYGESFGISVSTFNMNNGVVTATGGDSDKSSYGIRATTLNVTGGTVTATGGNPTYSGGSYGVNATVTVSSGELTATGGTAADGNNSYGILGNATVTGGTVTTNGETQAFSAEPTLTGTFTVNAGDDANAGAWDNTTGLTTYKYVKVVSEPPHSHCVCGDDKCSGDGHDPSQVWIATNELPNSPGHYYLTADVEIASTWKPADGTFLCLNGCKIKMTGSGDVIEAKNFTLTDCRTTQGEITHSSDAEGSGVKVTGGGTFNMYGGSITNNKAPSEYNGGGVKVNSGTFNMYGGSITNNKAPSGYNGGGVYIYYSKTFNMYGGTISGNTASSGGGVYVRNNAAFKMYGGDITDNEATFGGGVYMLDTTSAFTMTDGSISSNTAANNGGGVYVYNGTFTVSGSPVITGNTVSGKANNVYLPSGKAITVNQVLEAGTNIGVKMDEPGVFAKPDDDNVKNLADYVSFFTSDDTNYKPAEDDTDLSLVSALVAVTGVTLDKNSVTLGVGGTETLTAAVEPDDATNKAVTWSSNDESVATVENGVVTAVGEGTATITVTTTDGSKTDTCVVTVLAAHEHPICGGTCGHSTAHGDEQWKPIGTKGELTDINEAGYYYLTTSIDLEYDFWDPVDGVVLDLNGKTLSGSGLYMIRLGAGVEFTVTDCRGTGRISHAYSSECYTVDTRLSTSGAVFNLYNGTISSNGYAYRDQYGNEFNQYGGSITSSYSMTVCVQDGAGAYNLFGGSVTNTKESSTSATAVCVRRGTTKLTMSGDVEISAPIGIQVTNPIVIAGALDKPSAPYTIYTANSSTYLTYFEFTQGWSDYMSTAAPGDYFAATTYSAGYVAAKVNSGELQLVEHTHGDWTFRYDANGNGYGIITATCGNEGCPLNGGSGTATCNVIIHSDFEYKYVDYACPVIVDTPSDSSDWVQAGLLYPEVKNYRLGEDPLEGTATLKVGEADVTNGTVPFTLQKGTLTATDITLIPPVDRIYSGRAKEVTFSTWGDATHLVTVYYEGEGLVNGKPVNAGTYTVKVNVEGSEWYNAINGLNIGSFDIAPKDISANDVTFEAIPDQYYTGSEVQPKPVIKYNGMTLVEDIDYIINAYHENVEVGTEASILINGTGNYLNSKTVYFNIVYATKEADEVLDWELADTGWFNREKWPTYKAKTGYEVSEVPNNFGNSIELGTEPVNVLYVKHTETGMIYQVAISHQSDVQYPSITGVSGNPTEWTKENAEIGFTAADGLSGVDTVVVTCDDGENVTYDADSFTADRNGTYTITVTDKAGNEVSETVTVSKIDKAVPSLQIGVPTGTSGNDGWFTSAVTVPVTAGDGDGESGLDKWYYSLNGGTNWTEGSNGSFVISADGDYNQTVKIKAVDMAGNETVTTIAQVKVDTTAPGSVSVTAKVGESDYVSGEWTTGNVKVTLSATDTTSGIRKYQYSTDNGENWTDIVGDTYTHTASTGESGVTYIFRAMDNAGNTGETSNSITVKKRQPYTIVFNANGGEGHMNEQTMYRDTVAALTANTFTRTGYTFAGWATTADGNMVYENQQSVKDLAEMNQTVTLYAKWTPIPYDIAYTLNGGTATNPAGYTIESEAITLVNPTREGYTFKGWSSTGLEGDTNLNVTIATGSTGDRSYTANWTPITYDISYTLNGGEETNPATYTIESETITLTNPTREGYTFKGWSGTGLEGDTNLNVTIAAGSVGDRTYTANWTANEYTITYEGMDGAAYGENNPVKHTYDTPTAVSNPTKTGYTFAGWKVNGGEAQTALTLAGDGYTADITLTATWTANSYKVVFNANGGEGEMADQSFTYDAAQALSDNAFTREGYKFVGWSLSSGGTAVNFVDEQNVQNLTAEPDGEVTLYAVWTRDIILSGTVVAPNVPNAEKLEVVLVGLDGTKYPASVTGNASLYHYTVTVPEGEYQLIVKDTRDGGVTVTAKEDLSEDKTKETITMTMPTGNKNSIVDSTAAGDYAPIVGGIDTIAKNTEGSNVTVTLTVTHEESDDNDQEHSALMTEAGAQKSKLTFLEIGIVKKVDTNPEESITETSSTIEIVVPFDTTRKQNFKVYRFHDDNENDNVDEDEVDILTTTANADGEYIEVGTGSVTIHAKFFSLYAIGYTDVIPYYPVAHSCTSKCDVCGGCEDAACAESACKDKCRLLGMNFTDVAEGKWYTEAIEYVYHRKMMEGVGNNLFDINGTTSRAMIVTILWRLEGEPVVNYLMQFEDVPAETWYTEAVRWAASEGIVEGYSDTAFGSTDPITREQFATILWRYAKYKGYDVSVGEDTNILSYEDAFSISEYAIPAMQWACGAGLMQGDGVNLTPKADATRAQAAALFQRFCENVAEK
ncbi:InlB B-repeat-containing protein [Lawsonibacter celer]|uniref:InlB B-repeat-containing protein n=1 Tax=Lawsonibacter celer TaxID=2986526 RepID=UPI0016445D96|nr:InlB B-repeat-containing protein [Lawsonibacter celer]